MLKVSTAFLLGLLAFCVGCTPSSEGDAEGDKSLSTTELVESATAASKEFDFLLSEDAGSESYEECVDQIKILVDSLPESLADLGVAQSQADKLAKAVEEVKVAYESFASAVKSNSPAGKMAKANSGFNKKLKMISKLFN